MPDRKQQIEEYLKTYTDLDKETKQLHSSVILRWIIWRLVDGSQVDQPAWWRIPQKILEQRE
jgi:hypothetical protein